MRIHKLIALLAFFAVCSIPACDCNSGYITAPEGDATATETAPSSEAAE